MSRERGFLSPKAEKEEKGGSSFLSSSFRPRRGGHLPKTFHFSLRDIAGISVRPVIKYPVKNEQPLSRYLSASRCYIIVSNTHTNERVRVFEKYPCH